MTKTNQPGLFDGSKVKDAINDLDCIYCKPKRYFRSFDHLAKHMYARHGPPTPATQTHEGWSRFSGVATNVNQVPFTGKATNVAKRKSVQRNSVKPPAARATRRGGGIPAPVASGNETEYNPFIKAADIGDIDAEAVLTLTGKVRIADSGFGEQVICEVKYDGDTYDWGFKVNGANHRQLFKRFGSNEKLWRGRVNVTIKEFNGNPYIAVDRN